MKRPARPRTRNSRSPQSWEAATAEFSRAVGNAYGPRLRQVVLYGSRARKSASKTSDVDLLVVLEDFPAFWPELRRLERMAYNASFGRGRAVLLSPFPVRHRDFENAATPFLRTVRREGKTLS